MENTVFLTSSGSQLFKCLNTLKSKRGKSHSMPSSSRKFNCQLTFPMITIWCPGLKNLFLFTGLVKFQEHCKYWIAIIRYFLGLSKSYKAFRIFPILSFWNLWCITSKSVFLHMADDSYVSDVIVLLNNASQFLTHHTLLISLTQNKSCISYLDIFKFFIIGFII